MRKHMKLIVSAVAILCMMSMVLVPAFAAASDNGKLAVADAEFVEKDGVRSITFDAGTISWAGLGTTAKGEADIQSKEGLYQIGLGPVDPEHVKDAYVEFAFEVATAGKYTLTIGYASKTEPVKTPTDEDKDKGVQQTRAANYSVNNGEVKALDVDQKASSWNTRLEVVIKDVELVAGKNTVTFTNPDNFDNNYIKAINVCDVAWELQKDADSGNDDDTQAPTDTQKPADTTGSTGGSGSSSQGPSAPATGFATAAIVLGIAATGAYICSKKH